MRYRYRSFFWPALLVLVGAVALLVNTGQLPVERLGRLLDLWPLILIVIGIELVPVVVNAGEVTARLHRPSGTPVSVEASGAGLSVSVDGRAYHALGHVAATQDLGSAGYRLRVNGAACTVTVDAAAPSG